MTVVTAGEVVVDWLATVKGQSFPDAVSFQRGLGGNAVNVAVGLSRLGTRARFIGKIGQDIHGEYLRQQLEAEQVDLTYLLRDDSTPTAQCYAFEDLSGEHTYFNWPRSNAAEMLSPADISPEIFQGMTYLHATGISYSHQPRRAAIEKAMSLARSRDMIVSFDANFATDMEHPDTYRIEEAFAQADILKFNQSELQYFARAGAADSLQEAARSIFERYRPLAVAVTLGPAGSFLLMDRGTVNCPAVKVASVCGVGAGDGFVAGLLHALIQITDSDTGKAGLRELPRDCWQKAGTYANAVGALVTTRVGAIDGLPPALDVDRLLNAASSQ